MTEQVRYDFQKTMAELTVENFFRELTKGVMRRDAFAYTGTRPHGRCSSGVWSGGYPGGRKRFSAFDRYEVNTIHRRLAVSAGHIYGKPIISNESFTWLRFPRFVVTLEQIKAAADSIFLDGVNQIVNHGYSYSKADAGEDMLAFYASTNINHTNTWWKYYKMISIYINRVCDFMQRGKPVVSTAIYLPQHDIWAEMPIADTHMCMKLNERLETACVDGIHKAGYWFDYVNDDVLMNWECYGYDTLLLIECDRIPVAVMKKFRNLQNSGRTVIAAEKLPEKSCGLLNCIQNTEEIRGIGEKLKARENVIITKDKSVSLLEALRSAKKPDVMIQNHSDIVGYVHRKLRKKIFIYSNVSENACAERFVFGMSDDFCVFDPMNGKEKAVRKYKKRKTEWKSILRSRHINL